MPPKLPSTLPPTLPSKTLLLTRPEAQARAFAKALGAGPWDTLIAPLTEIVALDWDRRLAEGVRGVILTSANAVPAVAALAPLPAWCVGAATGRVAAAAGFDTRVSGGDAAALIADLRAARPEGPLLHAHGRHLARDLAAALAPQGLTIRSAAVYAAQMVPWPAGLGAALSRRALVAPVFSPRAAAELGRRLTAPAPGSVIVAISRAAADKLPPALAALAHVCDSPAEMCREVRARLAPQP